MAEILNTHNGVDTGTPAPEGHDEKMIQLVEDKDKALQGEPPVTPEQPEKILGKFETQDDLVKAYQELEKKLGGGKPEGEVTDPVTPETTETTEDDAADKAVEAAGLNMDELSNRYFETGELADADYAALEAAGINREMVDQYIDGIQARTELNTTKILSEIGGQETFDAMSAWAQANMDKADLAKYNQDIMSPDFTTVKAAVESVAFRYQKAVGKDPQLVLSNNNDAAKGDVFTSTAQMTQAMKDPRYDKDPAYRAEIAAKLARSNIL